MTHIPKIVKINKISNIFIEPEINELVETKADKQAETTTFAQKTQKLDIFLESNNESVTYSTKEVNIPKIESTQQLNLCSENGNFYLFILKI